MALSPGKLAPSVAVLAFVGYCAWPSVSNMIHDAKAYKPPADISELAASILMPKLAPLPQKNPFGGMDMKSLLKAKEKKIEIKTTPAAEISKMPKNLYDPIGGLKLQATSVIGDERIAVINGNTYAPKDILRTGNALKPTFKIIDILPTKVLLGDNGRVLELTYTSGIAKSAPGAKGGKNAQSATAAKKQEAPVRPSGKPLAKGKEPAATRVTADNDNVSDTGGR